MESYVRVKSHGLSGMKGVWWKFEMGWLFVEFLNVTCLISWSLKFFSNWLLKSNTIIIIDGNYCKYTQVHESIPKAVY